MMGVEATAKVATFGGSGLAVFGWFTVTEWCALGGLLVAVMGLIVQAVVAHHRKRHEAEANARAAEEHAINMDIKRSELEFVRKKIARGT